MLLNKLKAVGIVVLVLGTGAAVMAYQMTPGQGPVKVKAATVLPSKVIYSNPAMPSDDVTEWVAGWPDLTNPPEDDPKTKSILEALEKPIAMHFAVETPLEDVMKYIREATMGITRLPSGIPIYVDPIGLQDADRTMADTVTINLEDIPLKITLRLLLKQLDLTYLVKDGLLTITSIVENDIEVTPFSIMEEKARRGLLTREQYKQLIEALKLKNQVEILTGVKAEPGGFQ